MRKGSVLGLIVGSMLMGIASLSAAGASVQPAATRVSCEVLSQCAGQDSVESAALAAAEGWLDLVDHDDFCQSWVAASCVLQNRYSAQSWVNRLFGIRSCLGKRESRKQVCAEYCCDPQGLPHGYYVHLSYRTVFSCGDPHCETLFLRCERDCACNVRWKVAHYSVRQ